VDDALAKRFTAETVDRWLGLYLPRLKAAVQELPEADLWWRPHDRTNSVGVLLRHLEGNVRQWILSGLGGLPDHRLRSREFQDPPGASRDVLVARLEQAVRDACEVVASLDARALLAPRAIQGTTTDGLAAVYHVLEHFGWHLGQIVWIAKLRAGTGHHIAFHDDAALNRARNP
jgi:hypothetical protein